MNEDSDPIVWLENGRHVKNHSRDIMLGNIDKIVENYKKASKAKLKEKLAEDYFCEYLKNNKINFTRQYTCSIGIVDILSDNYIYELKYLEHKREHTSVFFKAVGQLISYNMATGNSRKMCMVINYLTESQKVILKNLRIEFYIYNFNKIKQGFNWNKN